MGARISALTWLLGLCCLGHSHAQTDSLAYLMGHFDPDTHPAFAPVPSEYADRKGMTLRKEALVAFVQMAEAAKKDGIELRILSATRNFDRQRAIWESKWTGTDRLMGQSHVATDSARARAILRYSSMPGTSRHHWGTDVDINSLAPEYFAHGQGLRELRWLEKYAARFGFCRPYAGKGTQRTSGYDDEPWHWSYLPLSGPLLQAYLRMVRYTDISGFKGAEQAPAVHIIEHFVAGVAGCE